MLLGCRQDAFALNRTPCSLTAHAGPRARRGLGEGSVKRMGQSCRALSPAGVIVSDGDGR
jgi:hypothetical protein